MKITLLVLTLAVLSDLLDGFIARNFDARTVFGSWLDPAADKMLISAVLVTLTVKRAVPLWFCLVTMGKDIGLVLGLAILVARGAKVKIQPLLTGKLATVAQNAALLTAILAELGFPRVGVQFFVVSAAVATVISAVAYGRVFKRALLRN